MAAPNIDYTSRDYEGLRQSMLDYAATAFPDWKPASEGDFGVLMVEMMAYMGDVLSYYVDRAQQEAYLPTATQRSSVLAISRLLGYRPGTGSPAKGTVTLQSATGSPAISVPAGTRLATDFVDALDGPIIFETDIDYVVGANNGQRVVNVTEGETIKDATTGEPIRIAESTGLPDQIVRLPNPKVYQETVEVYVAGEKWLPIPYLLDADPNDKVYGIEVDDQGFTFVRFGDGLNGAIPALGLTISARYRVGAGAAGNLPAGRIVSVFQTVPGLSVTMIDTSVSTSSATTGGSDPESTESIRSNAPRVFNTQQRAITLADFEAFALSVPGVSRAKATAAFFSSVTVYIVGPDGGAPGDDLIAAVGNELQDRTLVGTTVSVGAPSFIPINVGSTGSPVVVEVSPTFSRDVVGFNVEQAIKSLLSFSEATLGDRLTVSELYSRIMDLDGVRYVTIPLMARDDSVQSGNADIQLQAWEFPTAGDVVVTTTGGLG